MFKKIIFGSLLLVFASSANAFCIKIPRPPTESWPAGWELFDTSTGINAYWSGACSTCGGGLGLGSVNIASNLVQPVGSIIADGGPVPLTVYGNGNVLEPERVLFLCSPDEEGLLYEGFIATNTNYMRNLVDEPGVPENVRTTYVRRVGWRATHMATGQYFTDKWQLRPLTGLDRDIYGRILVKAKNFSDVQMQYFKLSTPTSVNGQSYTSPSWSNWGAWDPFGWVVLLSHNNGPTATPTTNLSRCQQGQTLAQCPLGWSAYIPGHLNNLYASLGGNGGNGFTTYKGCQITQVTPSVIFPPISASELEAGGERTGTIQINFSCENGAMQGTATGQNAIGFKVTDFARQAALNHGFGNATGTGVTKLFSENYGDSGVAKGVAIELHSPMWSGPMNWLTSIIKGGGMSDGWYSPKAIASNPGSDPLLYSVDYTVKLSKFESSSLPTSVTPGTVYAVAEVLLVVQ